LRLARRLCVWKDGGQAKKGGNLGRSVITSLSYNEVAVSFGIE